jgi:hypothetical protein
LKDIFSTAIEESYGSSVRFWWHNQFVQKTNNPNKAQIPQHKKLKKEKTTQEIPTKEEGKKKRKNDHKFDTPDF